MYNTDNCTINFNVVSLWIVMLTLYYKPHITMNIIITVFHIVYTMFLYTRVSIQQTHRHTCKYPYKAVPLPQGLEQNIYKYMYLCIKNFL